MDEKIKNIRFIHFTRTLDTEMMHGMANLCYGVRLKGEFQKNSSERPLRFETT